MSARPLSAVVLAADDGTPTPSGLPKPLLALCGLPMVTHVVEAVSRIPVDRIVVVVARGADDVVKAASELAPPSVSFVEQGLLRGRGDALARALGCLPEIGEYDADDGEDVLVLGADTPLVRPRTLRALVSAHRSAGSVASVLTARLDDPSGYPRVVRDGDGHVARLVDDAGTRGEPRVEERPVSEVTASIYCLRRGVLAPALRRLRPDGAAGGYRLDDVVEVLSEAGYAVQAVTAADPSEALVVGDLARLADADREMRRRINEGWMRRGVAIMDPETTYLDRSVRLAEDVVIGPGCVLEGTTAVAAGARLGPGTHLVDCRVGPRAVVEQTAGRHADIGEGARVGPFAVLEPGSQVRRGAVTGPFYRGGIDGGG